MPFTILPAIDITQGVLGVYAEDGPRRVPAFAGDPLKAAEAFANAGTRWLHVVDMDLAFGSESRNAGVLAQIRRAFPDLKIQASGGVLDADHVQDLLQAGADRVVLGSAVLADEALTQRLLDRAGPGRALVGLEVQDGRIRSRGAERVDLDLMATLGWLGALGPPGYVLTDVSKVGRMSGPDLVLLRRVVRVGCPVLAAGGIRSLADLEAVREDGAAGAVVGRAALDGGLDLTAAFAWAVRSGG